MKKLESKLQILEKYFSIDGNIATLKLVYDTFSELINPNFGDDKIEFRIASQLLSFRPPK